RMVAAKRPGSAGSGVPRKKRLPTGMQAELRARLGRESKRLLGGEPVRLRSLERGACFLLSDCADDDAGSLVRDPRHLQLVGGDSAPLVIDIDSLHPNGAQAASDAAFCTERFVCATRALDAMLLSDIQMGFRKGRETRGRGAARHRGVGRRGRGWECGTGWAGAMKINSGVAGPISLPISK
ncbi:MAG: hypothetical protein SGPRY_006943, partial [Prymnesium sp.]